MLQESLPAYVSKRVFASAPKARPESRGPLESPKRWLEQISTFEEDKGMIGLKGYFGDGLGIPCGGSLL